MHTVLQYMTALGAQSGHILENGVHQYFLSGSYVSVPQTGTIDAHRFPIYGRFGRPERSYIGELCASIVLVWGTDT